MTTTNFSMQGIVNKVEAIRNSQSEVLHLEATVRIEHGGYKGRYGDSVTSSIVIPFSPDLDINPGHAVAIDIVIVDPFGARFQPALEMADDVEETVDAG